LRVRMIPLSTNPEHLHHRRLIVGLPIIPIHQSRDTAVKAVQPSSITNFTEFTNRRWRSVMFVLLQVYPPEVTAEVGWDNCCCVIAVDASEGRLRQFLTAYERRYQAAVTEFDLWDDMAKDWGPEHDHKRKELASEYAVHGALVPGTRFKIVESRISDRPVPVRRSIRLRSMARRLI